MIPRTTFEAAAANLEERRQEFSFLPDVELLRRVIRLEEAGAGMKFPSLPPADTTEDDGRNFASLRKLGDPISFERLLDRHSRSDWRLVYETYCDIAVKDWAQMWESCWTGSFTSLLKHPESALCLALLAWKRCGDSAPASAQSTVWQMLEKMDGGERQAALAAFGYDGAVSAAYEGIAVDPAELAK